MAHIGVRIPADEKEQLMAIARESNTTLSHLIRQMIKAMMGDESSHAMTHQAPLPSPPATGNLTNRKDEAE